MDNNDNIFVTDQGYSHIQKFTSDGRFIASIGEYGSGELQFDGLFAFIHYCYVHCKHYLHTIIGKE